MTVDEAVEKALRAIERARLDIRRRNISSMLAMGHSDEEIEDFLLLGDEEFEQKNADLVQRVRTLIGHAMTEDQPWHGPIQ